MLPVQQETGVFTMFQIIQMCVIEMERAVLNYVGYLNVLSVNRLFNYHE